MAKETIRELVDRLTEHAQALETSVDRGLWGSVYIQAKECASAAAKLMQRADTLQDYTTSAYARAEVDRAINNGHATK